VEDKSNLKDTNLAKTNDIKTANLVFQGFLGIVIWMSFGLLLEGFIGFRVSAYMSNVVRRELFQLAHTHGTLLNILLLITVLALNNRLISMNSFPLWVLRIGTILMPIGFLLGGIWIRGEEPNSLIFLAPIGGIMVIFGMINALFNISWKKIGS
jgi:hypothetical protein